MRTAVKEMVYGGEKSSFPTLYKKEAGTQMKWQVSQRQKRRQKHLSRCV